MTNKGFRPTVRSHKRALECLLSGALYDAAAKVGMDADLRRAQVEVAVSMYNGETTAYITWEQELCEHPEFVAPYAAIKRAEKWLAAYIARNGVK